ncbi:MAG: hypothetical protein IKN18_04175 [Neisseriaceae bacterium]|nr:hypothetical protein [Neisseriaceae bacterium]
MYLLAHLLLNIEDLKFFRQPETVRYGIFLAINQFSGCLKYLGGQEVFFVV